MEYLPPSYFCRACNPANPPRGLPPIQAPAPAAKFHNPAAHQKIPKISSQYQIAWQLFLLTIFSLRSISSLGVCVARLFAFALTFSSSPNPSDSNPAILPASPLQFSARSHQSSCKFPSPTESAPLHPPTPLPAPESHLPALLSQFQVLSLALLLHLPR